MKLTELVPSQSKYLSKDDVGEAGRNLTIKGFKREPVKNDAGTNEDKAVMYFEEDIKPMILNKTNMNRLAVITKAETTGDCKGKTINVFCDPMVEFGGKIVGGLRIRAEQAVQQPAPADDDDLPF